MGTILVTGFEPFGGDAENPSAEIVRALHDTTIADTRVVGEVLPVEYGRLDSTLHEIFNRVKPRLVLGLGLASGRPAVCLERYALNICDASDPDNAGIVLRGQSIVEGGPPALAATIELESTCSAVRQAGIPCLISNSAGAFLCNRLFYALLHRAMTHGAPAKVGFVHVPYASDFIARHERSAPSLPIGMLIDAVRIVLRETYA